MTITVDQPPAIESPAPQDIVSRMQRLAAATPSTDKAREILATYESEEAREVWVLVWNIEATHRALTLRKQDPHAVIPSELAPIRARSHPSLKDTTHGR